MFKPKPGTGYLLGIVDLQIDNRVRVVDSTDMGRTKQYCLSLSVSNLCLLKRGKNLTLKTCAPLFLRAFNDQIIRENQGLTL